MQEIMRRLKTAQVPIRLLYTMLAQAKFWFIMLILVIALIIGMVSLINHSQSQDAITVSLYAREDILPLQQVNNDLYNQPDDNLLRVAVAGVLSPSKTLETYQELMTYMGQTLGRRVLLILKPTYAEINDLIQGGRADVAFVCSLAYVKGSRNSGMELLVVPQIHGHTVYYSYLIVPQDSSSSSLEDLRDGSFAFTDPLSNSGHLVPTYQLFLLDETPTSFFKSYIYTYSHDNSIEAVADKLMSGAAVDSLVYDHLVANNSELASKIKIIARWGPYGIPPVVVGTSIDPRSRQQLEDFFVNIHKSDRGMDILDKLSIDKFVLGTDGSYDSIKEMAAKMDW